MYILQNAWKNIGRNKGRNILMAIIILVIIYTSSVALIINNTANGIIDNYKQRFGSEVTIEIDMDKLQQPEGQSYRQGGGGFRAMQLPESPSPEQYISFADSKYIKEAQFSGSISVYDTDEINFIDEDKGGGGMMRAFRISSGPDGNIVSGNEESGEDDTQRQYYAQLYGYNYEPEEFQDGTRQLSGDKFSLNDGECIVSYELLENSGLNIGDMITLTSTLGERGTLILMPGEEAGETIDIEYTLKIVGYYELMTDEYDEFIQDNESMQNAYMNKLNYIYTTANTLVAPMQDGFDGIDITAKYFLKNPADLDNFAAELYDKGLDAGYKVSTDTASYETIVKPVEGLKVITLFFLGAVLILGAIILVLLSTISIRERKYEIGVLRAMGMKKSRVASGLLSEVVTITLVCLIFGLGSGIASSQFVSDSLLKVQLEQIESQTASGGNNAWTTRPGGGGGGGPTMVSGAAFRIDNFGGGSFTTAEALKEMDVSLSALAIAEIILVSLVLAIMASIVGIVQITRYEPIKILSERN